MAKKRSKEKRRMPAAVESAGDSSKKNKKARGDGQRPSGGGNPIGEYFASKGVRETIESIAIAFILAFLFRTFEAEAFVIPTGSMAETLRGRHREVACQECGYVHLAGASEGNTANDNDVVASTCPVCRHVNQFDSAEIESPYHTGDRILVSKFVYDLDDPERWDVVVFKFPFNAKQNYIKRLVGKPGEDLKISGGDIWVRPLGSSEDYTIARKPPEKLLAMMQVVHDTDYVPAVLANAGWPSRWQAQAGQAANDEGEQAGNGVSWREEPADTPAGNDYQLARASYHVDATNSDRPAWLRYHHYTPDESDWSAIDKDVGAPRSTPRLVTDFIGYNAYFQGRSSLDPEAYGLHWVGDLALEVDVDVESDEGILLLDLVEAGRHFQCVIDVSDGTATLSIMDIDGVRGEFTDDAGENPRATVTGPTSVRKGAYHLRLANADSELTLWVDDQVIAFDGPTTYATAQLLTPDWNDSDAGDLAPAGVGSQGAKLTVRRLRVLRDVYYIAVDYNAARMSPRYLSNTLMDYRPGGGFRDDEKKTVRRLLDHPQATRDDEPLLFDNVFASRRSVDFDIPEDHFFTCGDNSPQSQDARIWHHKEHFVHRQYMIGKALFIYWPYAKGPIYLPNPWDGFWPSLPIVPNFERMRFVR